jgi:hypothetical protein
LGTFRATKALRKRAMSSARISVTALAHDRPMAAIILTKDLSR